MDHKTYLEYCADLCQTKKMDPAQFLGKMMACGAPGTTNTTVTHFSNTNSFYLPLSGMQLTIVRPTGCC